MPSVRSTLTPPFLSEGFKQGVQAAHPVLQQRRHRMCAGDISEGRLGDVLGLAQVARAQVDELHSMVRESGSTTSKIFSNFVLESLAKPCREFIPCGKPVVLFLDSGGGSFLHLSPAMLSVCISHGIRPFFLAAWTTKALMALDMNAHETMARLWREFKQAWSHRGRPLTLFVALKAARDICDEALCPDVARASSACVQGPV